MARVRVHNFAISIDGYGAGPRQTREEPLGVGGEALTRVVLPDAYVPAHGREDRRHHRRR